MISELRIHYGPGYRIYFHKRDRTQREMGIRKASVDAEAWRPDLADTLRVSRPDKSAKLKTAHEAAALKRLLDERIALADAPGAIWHDASDVFDELSAGYAG